jgi:integrase
MPTRKLTKRILDSHPCGATESFLWDTEVSGFGVRIHPSGRRTFVFKCRPGGGRGATQRKITIGEYGALTVDQARRHAQRLAGEIAAGRDPGAVRDSARSASRAAREAPDVHELGEEFLSDVLARRKATTAREYRRLWNSHVVPVLGAMKVTEVTAKHITKLHGALHDRPYVANRTLALLGSFFTFAERNGNRERHSNPARDVEPFPERARERYLTREELSRLGDALAEAERVGLPAAPNRRRTPKTGPTAKHRPRSAAAPKPANPYAVAAIRFLLLTGWREREALTLRWDEINLEQRRATLPETKTGRSTRPLGAPACELLAGLPRVERSPFVFPGLDSSGPLVEINRVWYAARHRAGLSDVRLHDLRHTFASTMAGGRASLLMIGKALGHLNARTTNRYAHLHDDPLLSAVDAAASDIAARISRRGTEAAVETGT